ncbi:MAG: Flp pilus assembly complex ATPase component TadA [Firmicutes bacterium]|nr:Flp pilus assembly complex ATPase component TadA [Bacillota bacterium]
MSIAAKINILDKLKFLPSVLLLALQKLDIAHLQEIRIRGNKPVRVLYQNNFIVLLTPCKTQKIIITSEQIAQIVLRAAEFSIYAFNNQLSCGYITIQGGIRIGVAGELVYEGHIVKTQKNFTSLVIRIPHEIYGCANRAYKCIQNSKNKNTLIISPPGAGKTTLLRDLTRQISNAGNNILLVDERNEIAACLDGIARLDIGDNTDIINNAQKDYAFSFGIRSLRPDYIITDELANEQDIKTAIYVSKCGVKIIASVHADSIFDLKNREEFNGILEQKIFGRYIILSSKNGAGTFEAILDEDLRGITI